MFGYGLNDSTILNDYESCRQSLNNHMWNDFFLDFGDLNIPRTKDKIGDYSYILDGRFGNNIWGYYKTSSYSRIYGNRTTTLGQLYNLIDTPIPLTTDKIQEIFGGNDILVRYINAIKTDVVGKFNSMFIADDYCHLFVDTKDSSNVVKRQWHKFDAIDEHVRLLVENKRLNWNYEYSPEVQMLDYGLNPTGNWTFKMLNRNLNGSTAITDAYAIQCADGVGTNKKELWYVPQAEDSYFYSNGNLSIHDMAYEQNKDILYVLFKDGED